LACCGFDGVVKPTPSQLDRIEAKLDSLLAALAEDEDDEPQMVSLDGKAAAAARDQTKSL